MSSSRYIIFFGLVATFILWQLLLPGYVLTLDMVFTPEIHAGVAASGYSNFLPLGLVLGFLNTFIPAFLIQKMILFSLFFLLGFLSFLFLPVPRHRSVQLFCALLYTVNPFVYSRFLAGHWTHLFAYALLPVFFHFLFAFVRQPDTKKSLKLFATIFIISIFSLHFFVMAVLVLCFGIVFLSESIRGVFRFERIKPLLLGGGTFLVLSLYWLLPVLVQGARFEHRFDVAHFEAFAPRSHGTIGVVLNLLSLNGFWGESEAWGAQFAWVQDFGVFWFAIGIVWLLALFGSVMGCLQNDSRREVVFVAMIAFFSFIFATGAGDTVFRGLNLFLFEHIDFWRGFRDSQKFIGVFAVCLVTLFGYGVHGVFEFLKGKKFFGEEVFRTVLSFLIIVIGFFVFSGFRGQLRPVWYPSEWHQAQKLVQELPVGSKALFLPWHGYVSFGFNNNLILANPAKSFFGSQMVVSRSIELKNLYDQEVNMEYRNLDSLLTGKKNVSSDEVLDALVAQNIVLIVFAQDLLGVDSFSYDFLKSERVFMVLDTPKVKVFSLQSKF